MSKILFLISVLLICSNIYAQNSNLCTGSLGDPIVNITFGSGNNPGNQLSAVVPGASTTYGFTQVFGNPASPVPLDGNYTITNNVPSNSDWFYGATDHTGDANGYMAFFNANPTPGEFYKQTVSNLCPGTSYQFSAWIANVLNPYLNIGVQPDVTFRIEKTDGTLIASYKTGDIPQSYSMTWKEYGFFFTSPSDGSTVVLKMINTNIGGDEQPGNDFAIDDITFRACTAQLTASFNGSTLQNSLTVCPNTSVTLYGDANPQTGNYDYLWQVSTNNGVTWADIANSNKLVLTVTSPSQAGITYQYRMLSSQKGNIASVNCRGASDAITLTTSSLCTKDKIPCSNWYYNINEAGAFRAGDLDVTGHTITVEADINRTEPYIRQGVDSTIDGDIVSKHQDRTNSNYLLRPNRTEITTSNGYFRTPDVCEIELNKTYHVAMTYDGATLKFYRNGFLMSSAPATGDLITNDFPLTIGNLAYSPGYDNSTFKGYINNVRIWSVVRTQSQIQSYMDSTLPNPPSQTGLLADYRFDDLTNKQGNASLDGGLINGAIFNQSNPTCGSFVADSCDACGSNWLQVKSNGSGVKLGDIDIAGQKITVEATFNSTQTHSGGRLYAGDIVSKHTDPNTINYLLRPNSAEITTTQGYFITPSVCDADLNKTYQVAMTYDGSFLKFYRNGFLMSQVACTGDLYQNNYPTTVGAKASQPTITPDESLTGYINDVRIWNSVRTQEQIKQYLNQPLPNPQSQSGLVAYYTFDNLINKQGNSAWNGTLFNNAAINQSNPTCGSFVADSCGTIAVPPVVVTASFNAPDTVCVNTSINLQNTSTNATSSYWSFCSADLNTTSPEAVNIGNPGNITSWPVFMDLVHEGDKYYGFLVDHHPGNLIRLDFGNSFLNTPTAVSLGNFGGILPADFGAEGIQMVKNNGNWYAIIVGGSTQNNEIPRIIKIAFGANILNTAPTATNWGNIGNLAQPIDLYVFYEKGDWYGFTTNAENNTITRFNFGSGFEQTPTGTNLGNFNGALNYPTGIYALNDEGNWHLFVTNYNGNSLTRLDFGNSLLNTATATNLGSLGGVLKQPRDISIIKSCNSLVGYAVNGSATVGELIKIDFHNDVMGTPTATSLGNNGNYSFPHSISKLFRVGNDLYSFIPNVNNNTITRLKFPGCTSSNIPNYQGANPPPVSYNSPGLYNVVLSVDEGLPTQTTFCKQIVVLDKSVQAPTKDTAICDGSQLRLSLSMPYVTYSWNTGSKDSFINVTAPGKYWVQLNKGYSCTTTDTFNVTSSSLSVSLGKDTGLCSGQTLLLNAGNGGSTYIWQDGSTKPTYTATKGGSYYVRVTNASRCTKTDTIQIVNYPSPVLSNLQDQKICNGNSAQLSVTANGTGNTYSWLPASTLNNSTIANPVAKPVDTTNYIVTVTNSNGCITKDTATVFVLKKPVVISMADTGFCIGNSVTLQSSVSNTTSVSWSPSTGLSNAQDVSPKASPAKTTAYILTGKNDGCSVSDTVQLTVYSLPVITVSNDTLVCGTTSVQLSASGGNKYQWLPATGLSNSNIANPVATVSKPVTYSVTVTDKNGCINKDSVHIGSGSLTQFAATTSTPEVCKGDSIKLNASGGNVYAWQPSQLVSNPADSSTYAIATTSTVYTVQINNQQCQTSATKDVAVTVNPFPQIRIAKSNDIDCRNQEATLTASGGTMYTWSPVDNGSDTSAITVMPDETTVYKVNVTSDKGCKSSDTVTVKVNIDLEKQYPMPNAFSPNGDGINDCFGIKSWNVIKVDFQIFDRWGMLLFHSTDPSNVCWDGRYNNKNQLDGTYIYKIYAITSCGIINKSGSFVLIRAAR